MVTKFTKRLDFGRKNRASSNLKPSQRKAAEIETKKFDGWALAVCRIARVDMLDYMDLLRLYWRERRSAFDAAQQIKSML